MNESEDLNTTRKLTRLVNQLGSLITSRRNRACAALREAPPVELVPLLTGRLAKDLRRTTPRWILRPMGIAFALVAANFCADMAIFHSEHFNPSHSGASIRHGDVAKVVLGLGLLMIASMVGIYGAAIVGHLCRYHRMWNSASLLSREDNANAVGPITELICRQAFGVSVATATPLNASVKTAWVQMLSTLTSDSASCLNSRQRRYLRNALHKEAEHGLVDDEQAKTAIAILHCLATIGDLEARPIVERISQWQYHGTNEQAIAAQAHECMQALNQMKEHRRTGAVLLRCSSDPGIRADILLRSANEAGVVDAAELLRSGGQPETQPGQYSAHTSTASTEVEQMVYVNSSPSE